MSCTQIHSHTWRNTTTSSSWLLQVFLWLSDCRHRDMVVDSMPKYHSLWYGLPYCLWLIHSFIHSSFHSFIHSSIHSSIHSFIHPSIHSLSSHPTSLLDMTDLFVVGNQNRMWIPERDIFYLIAELFLRSIQTSLCVI